MAINSEDFTMDFQAFVERFRSRLTNLHNEGENGCDTPCVTYDAPTDRHNRYPRVSIPWEYRKQMKAHRMYRLLADSELPGPPGPEAVPVV